MESQFYSTMAPPSLFPQPGSPEIEKKRKRTDSLSENTAASVSVILEELQPMQVDLDESTTHDPPDRKEAKFTDTDISADIHPVETDREMIDATQAAAQSNPIAQFSTANSLDLAERIKGYRLLELISEQASSGLVNKIVISQEHLGRFINYISPGAYDSLTKVDFAALDQYEIRPVGVYGSKSEIVRFLLEIKAIEEDIASFLNAPDSHISVHTRPTLTSGLYIFQDPFDLDCKRRYYVVLWPEETTWNDDATPAVVKNRVTFMRYLTKITDQVLALISPEHAQALVFRDAVAPEEPVQAGEDDDDNEERMFSFKVSKTNEQSEGVTVHPGFELLHPGIHIPKLPSQAQLDDRTLQPIMVPSETQQAFLTVSYEPEDMISRPSSTPMTEVALQSFLRNQNENLYLSDHLQDDALEVLTKSGLDVRFQTAVNAWKQRNLMTDDKFQSHLKDNQQEAKSEVLTDHIHLEAALELVALQEVDSIFRPFFNKTELTSDPVWKLEHSEILASKKHLEDITSLYPKIQQARDQAFQKLKLHDLSSKTSYKRLKNRFLIVNHILNTNEGFLEHAEKQNLVDSILTSGELEQSLPASLLDPKDDNDSKGMAGRILHNVTDFFTMPKDHSKEIIRLARQATSSREVSDLVFLQRLPEACEHEPLLLPSAVRIGDAIRSELRRRILNSVRKAADSIESIQLEVISTQVRREAEVMKSNERRSSRLSFIHEVNSSYASGPPLGCTLESIIQRRGAWNSRNIMYDVSSRADQKRPARLSYSIHILALTGDDKHKLLEFGYEHIPQPSLTHPVPMFSVPVGEHIRHIQLFENNRCLLILGNSSGDLKVFLDEVYSLGDAVTSSRTKVVFSHTKLGPEAVIAVDETHGLLAVVTSEGNNCRLHVYRMMITENSSPVTARGTPITLHSWHVGQLHVTKACFVTGAEEILLVDGITARIYSLITQQYRPAPLQFFTNPSAVFSTPDGACLLAVEQENKLSRIRAYHWESFGSKEGIILELPGADLTSFSVTSLTKRSIVHVLMLSPAHNGCRSASLCITQRSSEFQFRAQNQLNDTSPENPCHAQHNCLLDCHSAVWTRFPVLPAIGRSTIRSEGRMPSWLQFITADHGQHDSFATYMRNSITSFERNTRKPFDEALLHRNISGVDKIDLDRPSSCFCTGEWLVELLCLIPIQICVVRDNRFIPLRDGVFSPDLERSLLGADLAQVVDSITFGWYESLLGSYYIGKEVKVVSSMGQQSVGKSYMINHFTDSSFQGSAMRTTEGCWMSLTPTEKHLIISLDFEGLDSIERSAQEDTLLVLFNAAISNLVLFRNNFALSRDLAGSFQSFQSSSLVLDPAANPTLFQGKLAIIVKDVIDADKNEIVKEFSEKLHHIVTQERDSNFITRLHNGSIDIIPWPVIESRKFYTMFEKLQKNFYSQKVTHPGAGVFLSTMKTLMAKLKINDWGALDQNLSTLRAQRLESILPVAFGHGLADIDLNIPLKDIDSDTIIRSESDTSAVFYIQTSATGNESKEASQRLSHLRGMFTSKYHRQDAQWSLELSSYLNTLVEARIQLVQQWLDINTSRFASHANIMSLQRKAQDTAVALKSGIQLCNLECQKCRLVCVEPRHHAGHHDCNTDHDCTFACEYCSSQCDLAAGHDSTHICSAGTHLCGKSCDLGDKRGCLGACTKTIDHIDEEHLCSTRNHQCGEACALNGIRLADGSRYTCPGTCTRPFDEYHDQHACEDRSCPIPCQLCKRLCCLDHLHGLGGEIHLCGQEHPCQALCGQDGVCEIATQPHSVETTYRGTVDTFQFTKYSQVVKRLPCAVLIPLGELEHEGAHSHSVAPDAFHYCEARCCNCDYICTLPYGTWRCCMETNIPLKHHCIGHAQQEHETSHGSCSKTQWAIEGPPGSIFELEGHKYAANDSGAPLLCNMVCVSIGRHAHVDYCRAQGTLCEGPQLQHINARMLPQVDQPKDYITHELSWSRTGFKDPYTREEQVDFSKCDHMCGGPEHDAAQNAQAQPSHCTLPMFHLPQPLSQSPSAHGYVSRNGHAFSCRNPSIGHQAFHVIFVIDRSGSMGSTDRWPQLGSTATARIVQQRHNNRLGAVYSALYSFWTARNAALGYLAGQGGTAPRRDSYSVVLFDHDMTVPLENDFTNSPDQLLDLLLPHGARGGTDFNGALRQAHLILESNWSAERSPVVIFLSDGECSVKDNTVYDLAQKSQALGKSLCFHAVSFGPDGSSYYLRRMIDIAAEVYARAPRDALAPAGAGPCSYTEAIDTIRLSETFLGFAESLQKPRASLLRG